MMNTNLKHSFSKFCACETGVTGVEYGMIGALVSVAIIGSVSTMSQTSSNSFMRVAVAMATGGDMDPLTAENGNGGLDTEAPTNSSGGATWAAGVDMEGWDSTFGMEVWKSGFQGVTSYDGDTHVELDGGTNNGEIDSYSTNVPTVDGQLYDFSFALAQRGNTQESVVVKYDGEVIDVIKPDSNQWEVYTYQVAGTGGQTKLTFEELEEENNSWGIMMDAVRFEQSDTAETP